MSGPFKMKGFGGFGNESPAKHTEEASGFAHPHPHTEDEEKIAKEYKKKRAKTKAPVGVASEKLLKRRAKGWGIWEKGKRRAYKEAENIPDQK
jgi:hypothetical protein